MNHGLKYLHPPASTRVSQEGNCPGRNRGRRACTGIPARSVGDAHGQKVDRHPSWVGVSPARQSGCGPERVYNEKVHNESAAEPQTEQPVTTKALQEIRTNRLQAAIVVLLETRYNSHGMPAALILPAMCRLTGVAG